MLVLPHFFCQYAGLQVQELVFYSLKVTGIRGVSWFRELWWDLLASYLLVLKLKF